MSELLQPVSKPASERLAHGPRWSWEFDLKSGLKRILREEYAMMAATQGMHSQISKVVWINRKFHF